MCCNASHKPVCLVWSKVKWFDVGSSCVSFGISVLQLTCRSMRMQPNTLQRPPIRWKVLAMLDKMLRLATERPDTDCGVGCRQWKSIESCCLAHTSVVDTVENLTWKRHATKSEKNFKYFFIIFLRFVRNFSVRQWFLWFQLLFAFFCWSYRAAPQSLSVRHFLVLWTQCQRNHIQTSPSSSAVVETIFKQKSKQRRKVFYCVAEPTNSNRYAFELRVLWTRYVIASEVQHFQI